MKVTVDQGKCVSVGNCVANAPDVFDQDEDDGSVILLLALSGVFALAVIGIGLIISTTAKNQVQATQLAIATLLPSIFLSGFIYPRDTMPLFFYTISYFLPLTYFLDILRGIVLRGAEFINLVNAVVPLSFMAVTLFSLSVIKFRKRLD